jgi:hypothetical protein
MRVDSQFFHVLSILKYKFDPFLVFLVMIFVVLTLSQQGPINVERAPSMARSMTSPIHIFGLVHAM